MIVTLHELGMQGWTGLQQGGCGRGGVWAKDKGREVGCLENGEQFKRIEVLEREDGR